MVTVSKRITYLIAIILIAVLITWAGYTRGKYKKIYNTGVSLLETGKYDEAAKCFSDIPNYTKYRDVSQLLDEYGISVCPHCGSLLD